jgi:hypothetical protein
MVGIKLSNIEPWWVQMYKEPWWVQMYEEPWWVQMYEEPWCDIKSHGGHRCMRVIGYEGHCVAGYDLAQKRGKLWWDTQVN